MLSVLVEANAPLQSLGMFRFELLAVAAHGSTLDTVPKQQSHLRYGFEVMMVIYMLPTHTSCGPAVQLCLNPRLQ